MLNTDKRIERLRQKRISLMNNDIDTLESISVLEDITEIYVLENCDKCALECYEEYICELEKIVGTDVLYGAYRSKLIFYKELMVMAADSGQKIMLCRDFVKDVFEYCGITSKAGLHAIELFFVCCYDTGETEEMRLFCREIEGKLSNASDDEGKFLYFLCQNFDILQYGNVSDREKVLAVASEVFGEKSLFVAEIKRDFAKYNCDSNNLLLLKEVYESHCAISGGKSVFALRTEYDIVISLIKSGAYKNALATARGLYKKCNSLNYSDSRIPDAAKALALALFFNGKKTEALKYFEESHSLYRKYFFHDPDRSNILFFYGAVLTETGNYERGSELLAEYCEKMLLYVYKSFLSNDMDRAVNRAVNIQKRFYDAYIIFASDAVKNNPCQTERFYDIICKYKTFIYDCEFLHTLFYRDDVHGEVLKELNNRLKNETSPEKAILLEKEILNFLRQYDYVKYFENTDINTIKRHLETNEILIDFYYCKTADGGYYLPVRISNNGIEICEKIPEEKIIDSVKETSDIVINRKNVLPNNPFGTLFNVNAEKVYISVDGELFKLPLELFIDDSITVSYLISAKDIVNCKNGSAANDVGSVSVFAAPSTDTNCSNDERSDTSGFLFGSLAEALLISEIFPDKANLYLGENATANKLFNALDSDVLHIASHATGEDGGTIYLSGTNCEKVTCHQIAGSNMSSVRLAVLSCCKTGGGKYLRYYGTTGLRRAFGLAGVGMVITSFWEIDDIVTSVFMFRFYSFISQGLSPCNALAETKRYLKNVTVRRFIENDLAYLSKILIQADLKCVYRVLRDYCSDYIDEEKPFSSAFFWAGFALFGGN